MIDRDVLVDLSSVSGILVGDRVNAARENVLMHIDRAGIAAKFLGGRLTTQTAQI